MTMADLPVSSVISFLLYVALAVTSQFQFFDWMGRTVSDISTPVFFSTKYDGIDPEISGGADRNNPDGIDNYIYPRPFTIQLGLSLNF